MNATVLNAINSTDGLQQAVGIAMFSKANNQQADGAATLLQDFSQSQRKILESSVRPHIGQNLDVSI